ncbi:MAG: DNA repair protein RecN [Flavobacteriaceae bacterium]|nr:DNA repair protein RecN [Flavobacteriaceae bacterium]
MLSKITIQNFALIQHLHISLDKGLQVITGETGAGKSIILGALRLILGERVDAKSIANPEQKSIVEAEFRLNKTYLPFFEENDLDFEEETLIRREILPSGKSRAFINDVPVTLDVLKELALKLIDIHSQFETSKLFSEEYQFKIIDGLSENKQEIEIYQADFKEYQNLKQKLKRFEGQLLESNKEADYQKFLLEELEEMDLDNVDLEELKNQVSAGENAEQILESLGQVFGRFQQEEIGVLGSLNEMKNKLQKIADASTNLEGISQRLEEAYLELKDISESVEQELDKFEINPEAVAVLVGQLNKINGLLLKHQVDDILGLIEIRDRLAQQQQGSEDLEKNIEKARRDLENSEQKLTQKAEILSENRKKMAVVFAEKAEELFGKLGLERAKIQVDLLPTTELNKFGKEQIQLMFQANTGFPLKPIQSAISGGERSRVMLSIKKIMAENSELPTLILDEIDSGVSGKTADEIGKVMQDMAKDMQLIVITHHAQVAAKGNNHYKVVKQDVEGKTQSTIIQLDEEQKLNEIAQILSGSTITEAAVQQARELMKK